MKRSTRIRWAAALSLAVAMAFWLKGYQRARATTVELEAAQQKQRVLELWVGEAEARLRDAERAATEAEQDRAALAKALQSIQAAKVAATRPSPPPTSNPPQERDPRTDEEKKAVGDSTPREQQFQMTQERLYSQELAKMRRGEAMQRAKFDEEMALLDPAQKFRRRMEEAATYAAEGKFQAAIRIHNQAIAEKPADVSISESERELASLLREQNTPVVATLVSDGATSVSVANFRGPKQFVENRVEILPGDYQVIGRRPGYRDVVMPVQIRAGNPPPVLTIVCTEPI